MTHTHQAIDPNDIHSDDWEVYEITPEFRRSRLWLDDTQYIVRTEYFHDKQLFESNKQSLDESQTQRFGEGKVVGRIPMHVFSRELAPRLADEDHFKWWLNNEKNRQYRTFRGKV
jgi:hypothetical protein